MGQINNDFYNLKIYKKKFKKVPFNNYLYLLKKKRLLNYNFLYFIKNIYIKERKIYNKVLYKNYKKFYIINKFLYNLNKNTYYLILKLFLILLNNNIKLNSYKRFNNIKLFLFKISFLNTLKKLKSKQIKKHKYLYFSILNNYKKRKNIKKRFNYKKIKNKKVIDLIFKNSNYFSVKKSTITKKKIYKYNKIFYIVSLNLKKFINNSLINNSLINKKIFDKKNKKKSKYLIDYFLVNNLNNINKFNIFNNKNNINDSNIIKKRKNNNANIYIKKKVYKYKCLLKFISYEVDYYNIINKFHNTKWANNNFKKQDILITNNLYYNWKSIKIYNESFIVINYKKKNFNNYVVKKVIRISNYLFYSKELLNYNKNKYNIIKEKRNKKVYKYIKKKVYKYKCLLKFISYEVDYYNMINKFHNTKWANNNFKKQDILITNNLYYNWKSIKIYNESFIVINYKKKYFNNYIVKKVIRISNYLFYSKELLNYNKNKYNIIERKEKGKKVLLSFFNSNFKNNLNYYNDNNKLSWNYYIFINNSFLEKKKRFIIKSIKSNSLKKLSFLWKKKNWFTDNRLKKRKKKNYYKIYNKKKKRFIIYQNSYKRNKKEKLLNIYNLTKKKRFYRYNNILSFFLNYKKIKNNNTLLFKNIRKKLKILFKRGLFKKNNMYFFRRTLLVEYPKWSLIKEKYFQRNEENIMSYLSKYMHLRIYNIYRKIYNIDTLFLKKINKYKNINKVNYSKILIGIKTNLLQYFYSKNKKNKFFLQNSIYYNKFLIKNISIKNYILFNNYYNIKNNNLIYNDNYKYCLIKIKNNNLIYNYYKYFLKILLFNNLLLNNNYNKIVNCNISLFINKIINNLNLIYKYINIIKDHKKRKINYYSKLNEINLNNNIYDYDYSLLNNNNNIIYNLNTISLINYKKK